MEPDQKLLTLGHQNFIISQALLPVSLKTSLTSTAELQTSLTIALKL